MLKYLSVVNIIMKDDVKVVKQVDGYVAMLLETYKQETKTNIDPENPSREDRIHAALHFDRVGKKWLAVEIMAGERIDPDSKKATVYNFLLAAQTLFPQNTRRFYEGFPETH